jgi:hypothetical protein
MTRWLLSMVFACAGSVTVAAHFVFVVPEAGGLTATVLLSETLQPDAQVDAGLIAATTLSLRVGDGAEAPLRLTKTGDAFRVSLGSARAGLIHGLADLGVMKTGSKPHILLYHPKTIVGDPFGERMTVGAGTPVELIPARAAAGVRLRLIARGQPQPGADVTVILPDGSQKVVKTDRDGATEVFASPGRYGAWARFWEAAPGTRSGQAYDEVRHYATLVFDAPAVRAAAGGAAPERVAARIATLPEATSSFGAVASDGWLYVYGGHIVPTHSYSTAAVSGQFHRLRLGDGHTWERLPDGPPLQGLNLAAHSGRIYRVGGMQPQNKPGEAQDVRSVADVARFDPANGRWESLPPLPMPRSSHDVVVVGNTLFVVGGWTLRGKAPTQWPDWMDVLDLAAPTLAWKKVSQPFKRRALIAAAHDGRVFVLGGFDDSSRVVRASTIYDVARGTWTSGPDLPGGAMNGFGPAATALAGALYVSVDDGGLFRLNTGDEWVRVGGATPRIVHRLVPDGRRVLIVGGAAGGKNSDLVEALRIEE